MPRMRGRTHTSVYILGGTSLVLTLIVTILHGLCYASFRTLSSGVGLIEAAVVGLSSVSCVTLLILIPLGTNDIRKGTLERWPRPWKVYGCGFILVYLLIVTGITAGGIAWSASQFIGQPQATLTPTKRSLMVARCVVWAISVLSQGTLGGYLLIMVRRRELGRKRVSHELGHLSNPPSLAHKGTSAEPSLLDEESRRASVDGKPGSDASIPRQPGAVSRAPSRISHRYSGRTLYHPDTKHPSLDLPPAALTYPLPTGGDDRSDLQRLYRSNSELKRSLDSLVLQSSSSQSSPTGSTFTLPAPPPALQLPDESNIHPLFRSGSPSPPPTATPGSIVVACPAAGQTISTKTLERVRSTHSLRSHTPRSRSPLVESMDVEEEEEGEGDHYTSMMAAQVRKSMAQYAKKYDLNESPHES
ncbi:hypothetical protein BDV59DRAFT_204399 [Aspergillus ambiguus]|uniref:uncharacterized protein n=1 Tax=Aspergillus ambiguus TaxID=176160 RepID=UPI003CCD7DAC